MYFKTKVLNHKVEFAKLVSGLISVGVDGRLIGNYELVRHAVLAATEEVRLVERSRQRPNLDEETWVALEAFEKEVTQ